MKTLTAPIALLAAAGLALAAPVATAQSTGNSAGQAQASDYDEATLEAFVVAANKIAVVIQEFRPQMQQADSEEQRDAIEQAANEEIIAAVESTDGITLETYSQIARAAQQDKALSDRLRAMMEQG